MSLPALDHRIVPQASTARQPGAGHKHTVNYQPKWQQEMILEYYLYDMEADP
jgi:hypothetical protein